MIEPTRLRRDAAERGFSLPETLVALLILAVVSLAIIGMFTHAVQLNASGLDYTALTNSAKDIAEELMALDYTDPALVSGTLHTLPDLDDPPLEAEYTVDEYRLDAVANDPATVLAGTTVAAGTGNLKVITVTVASPRAFVLGRRDVTVRVVKTTA